MLYMARALMTQPRLLLLDEPHEGLAPKIVDDIVAIIQALKSEGVSMLIAEQSIRTISECADRVVVIDRGRTVFWGTASEFQADPEIARSFLMVTAQE